MGRSSQVTVGHHIKSEAKVRESSNEHTVKTFTSFDAGWVQTSLRCLGLAEAATGLEGSISLRSLLLLLLVEDDAVLDDNLAHGIHLRGTWTWQSHCSPSQTSIHDMRTPP